MEEKAKEDIQPSEQENILETGAPLSIEEQVDGLNAEIDELERNKNQIKEALQRAQADLINYKRRSEEERGDQQMYSNSRLILKLLPVLDEFTMAIAHARTDQPESDEEPAPEASWLEGIGLIYRKLASLLESENVVRIEMEGKEFDPLEHEAMAYQESAAHQDGQILTVVRDGFKLHGRIIRPALVILAKNPEDDQGNGKQQTKQETKDA